MSSFRDIDDLIHTWAQNNDGRGACGNVSYDGPALYSYSQVIALHVGRGCLVGTGGSQTTTTHTNKAHSAVHGRRFVVHCDLTPRTTPADARAAWAPIILRATVAYAEATRKPSKAKHLRELRAAIADANDLCAFYDLPLFDAAPSDEEADAWTAQRAAAELTRRAEERQRIAARKAADALDARTRLAAWRDGGDVGRHGFRDLRDTEGDCLRVSADGDVETTQGARVPLADVQKWAPVLIPLVQAGEGWRPGMVEPRLGAYTVREVTASGDLVVGCHTFRRAEVERFATVIGVSS